MGTQEKKYRRNVAVFVLDAGGKILLCRRSDSYKAWQLPQGGMDSGETPREAMVRELGEEIGTKDVDIIHELEGTIRYDWPERLKHLGFDGQEQTYFLVRLRPEATIDLNAHDPAEFEDILWVGAGEFLARIEGFKKEPYSVALGKLISLFPTLIAP